jgi:hypothetical protein
MRTSTLAIARFSTERVLQPSGKYEENISDEGFDIQCSIQPLGKNLVKMLPEGYTKIDSRTVRTTSILRTTSQFTELSADETEIDGLTYRCFARDPWNTHGLQSDHNNYIFILKDLDV